MNLNLPHIYHREPRFHVLVNLILHNITIMLSGILIEKCSCQFNAKSGAIDQQRLADRLTCWPPLTYTIFNLFNCKPWLMKFFFIISCTLRSRAAYFFFFTLSKDTDDARPFLGYVFSTKFSLHILLYILFRIMWTSVTGRFMIHRRQL